MTLTAGHQLSDSLLKYMTIECVRRVDFPYIYRSNQQPASSTPHSSAAAEQQPLQQLTLTFCILKSEIWHLRSHAKARNLGGSMELLWRHQTKNGTKQRMYQTKNENQNFMIFCLLTLDFQAFDWIWEPFVHNNNK